MAVALLSVYTRKVGILQGDRASAALSYVEQTLKSAEYKETLCGNR